MGVIKEFALSCIDAQTNVEVVDHLLARCQDDLLDVPDNKLRELMGCLETTLVNRIAAQYGHGDPDEFDGL
jgi:hypothetical protein